MLFFHPHQTIFFLIYNKVYCKYCQRYKELKDFIFENFYTRLGFARENSYYSMKHQKKTDLHLFATKLRKKKKLILAMLRNPKQSFIPELQLKDTESAIKNKLIDSLTELKVFKVVTTLVLEFKKIQRDNVTLYIVPFI